ncbi:MAG: ergosterol biosynthesis protein [Thelocarpon superellum]|nr:MAG: ergosterol biosynthesis protein [Thelocarpon superellum]
MDTLRSMLPPHDGFLPLWLLLVAVTGTGNSIQAYNTLHYTRRVYSPEAVNPLSARTFGTWTLLTSVIRFYAAYHINDPTIYQMTLWAHGIAFFHFVSEWRYFRTTSWDLPLAFPICVASFTLVWMFTAWSYYVPA